MVIDQTFSELFKLDTNLDIMAGSYNTTVYDTVFCEKIIYNNKLTGSGFPFTFNGSNLFCMDSFKEGNFYFDNEIDLKKAVALSLKFNNVFDWLTQLKNNNIIAYFGSNYLNSNSVTNYFSMLKSVSQNNNRLCNIIIQPTKANSSIKIDTITELRYFKDGKRSLAFWYERSALTQCVGRYQNERLLSIIQSGNTNGFLYDTFDHAKNRINYYFDQNGKWVDCSYELNHSRTDTSGKGIYKNRNVINPISGQMISKEQQPSRIIKKPSLLNNKKLELYLAEMFSVIVETRETHITNTKLSKNGYNDFQSLANYRAPLIFDYKITRSQLDFEEVIKKLSQLMHDNGKSINDLYDAYRRKYGFDLTFQNQQLIM